MPAPTGGPTVPEATKTLYRGKHPADVPLYSVADVVRFTRSRDGRFAWPWAGRVTYPSGFPEPDRPAFSFRALVNVFLLAPGARWLTPAVPGLAGILVAFDHGAAIHVFPNGDMQPLGPTADDVPPEAAVYKARVEWDGDTPVRLYPFSRARIDEHAPRLIVIDPRVGFGNPVLAGRNIRTDVIAGRFRAGESVAELTEDLDIPAAEVEEAIRFESGYRA